MDEAFAVDLATFAANGPVEKLWSWRAKEREELPAALRGAFGTTDECKPVAGGKQVLITASSGGCALVDFPAGQVRWHARVANARSAELLPRNRVVFVQAEEGRWWSGTLRLLEPGAELPLTGERLYKARWWATLAPAPDGSR
jgi:hypothetical protein